MGRRGPKPQGKVEVRWSSRFAYGVGLLVSDGCLSPSGRHVVFVSKDVEQIRNFLSAFDIHMYVGLNSTRTPRVQFGDVLFYRFLLTIGLMPNKSKVLGKINVPSKYFYDFLRGVFDGDGSVYLYRDKRWPSSHMFNVSIASASPNFLTWIQRALQARLHVTGHITCARGHSTKQLKYGKREGLIILRRMYRNAPRGTYLSRKHLKITKMLDIVGQRLYLPGC